MLTGLLNRSEIWAGMIDFMFPPLCIACGAFNEKTECICDKCRNKILRLDYPICLNCEEPIPDKIKCDLCGDNSFPLYALGKYAPPLSEAIIQFKFKGIMAPAKLFARFLTEQFEDQICAHRPQFLVPIPLHPSHEHVRGYNQASLFANELSFHLDVPVRSDLIFRTRKRKPQAKLDLLHRTENIRSAFTSGRVDTAPLRIILADDVVTSGATIKEACRVLTEAGHIVVAAMSIAHAT